MQKPEGKIVKTENGEYYKIENTQDMAPFFINVASACDVWLFVSSRGGITAGRKNAQGAVFAYETEDRLHEQTQTGSRTLIKCGDFLWEPLEHSVIHHSRITRNLYKSLYGNSVAFEEINHDLQLAFRYEYCTSEKYGLVKTAKLTNLSEKNVSIELLDGLQNIIPYGVDSGLQATSSTLVDAYKASEFSDSGRLAVYSLTTKINDSPNAVEMLRANVAWCTKNDAKIALSSEVLDAFVTGGDYPYAASAYGKKGGFFVRYSLELQPSQSGTHTIVLDSGYSHSEIATLEKQLESSSDEWLFDDIAAGTKQLKALVAKADGIQESSDSIACSHHYLNTLYNIMRGGVFASGYAFDYSDFCSFVSVRNHALYSRTELIESLKNVKTIQELKEAAASDDGLMRIVLEYMPLSFSRRHGDPSRPWNIFNINLKDDTGRQLLNYEGNWRDIFQNWEALALSFPGYYENMIAKFVNASTIDGYNPYRINRDGIDWERIEPDSAFSGFGYWGDHQLIYLLRLLQGMKQHFPERLTSLLSKDIFSYANVPYRLNSYDELQKDSKNTITFDFKRDSIITEMCRTFGTDAKLVLLYGKVYTVTLMEKLLVPMLSKVSNLLCGGGIFMNTQRPEWNDANNTIVGIGLSMVTVYHLYSYIKFIQNVIGENRDEYLFSAEVAKWLNDMKDILSQEFDFVPGYEKRLLEKLGRCFSDYRTNLYDKGFSGNKVAVSAENISVLLQMCERVTTKSISRNKGELYTSYNLLHSDFTTEPMRPMLEGQSAVIGSGILDGAQVCELLDNADKVLLNEKFHAHYLYPVKLTRPFIKKNIISSDIRADGKIILSDIDGKLHFSPELETESALIEAMKNSDYSQAEQSSILSSYEETFAHKKFTGRSEVMYKFEGIGCIYWHQNAKLALAVLETAARAYHSGDTATAAKVYAEYHRLVNGFIYRKSPSECGAIPIEPYSHTSFNQTCQQPGMTGQVKESILARRGELGISVSDGKLRFEPWFLAVEEFDSKGKIKFTVCETPVTYLKDAEEKITVQFNDGHSESYAGTILDCALSRSVFLREGLVKGISVGVERSRT